MKRLMIILVVLTAAISAQAGFFWNLNYDYIMLKENPVLGITAGSKGYFNFDIGMKGEHGGSIAFRYDHIGAEDYVLNGNNARFVAVIPAVNLGFGKRMGEDDKFIIQTSAIIGYCASARYRLNATDYKASGMSYAGSLGVYYRLGQVLFFAGPEIGFRNLKLQFDDLKTEFDMSGIYYGISLKHLYE